MLQRMFKVLRCSDQLQCLVMPLVLEPLAVLFKQTQLRGNDEPMEICSLRREFFPSLSHCLEPYTASHALAIAPSHKG
eukprot:4089760-Amphidinium_carterae.1